MDKPVFMITDPGTVTLVTGGYAVAIDKKTGQVVKVVLKKPDPTPWKPGPDPWNKHVELIAAGLELMRSTEGVKAAEELRVQAAKCLASLVQTVATEVAGETIFEH